METRANYILVGAFAVAGFLGLLGFFLWFARVELDRQFAYYDIDFESVSGLSEASDVRYAGFPVGQVVGIRLSPENDGRVRVRIEVEAGTPVRTDSTATIEAQGVTGVSFVGISPGSPEAPLLAETSDADVPEIEAGRSVLQTLSQDAPEILAETLGVVRELRELLGGENRRRVDTILQNVEGASAEFATALEDFSTVTGSVSGFAGQIERFNSTLDALTGDISGALAEAETTIRSFGTLSEEARGVLAQGSGTLTDAGDTIATLDRYITEDLGPATEALGRSVTDIETRVARFGDRAETLIDTYAETGRAATARLTEARQTLSATDALIARIEQTLGTVDAAALRFDGLLAEDATPLIRELRVATTEATAVIRSLGDTAGSDLPALMDEVRGAAARAAEVVDRVGADLSDASGRLDGLTGSADETLAAARGTFERANETLAAINGALETGDRALGAAERAFTGADRVINEDMAGIVAGLETTLTELETAVGGVADEIPAVAEELRAASRSARAAFAEVEQVAQSSGPQVRSFADEALPQYTRLSVEIRALVDNLDALVEQIRRNPSRFFLDPRAPEFRR